MHNPTEVATAARTVIGAVMEQRLTEVERRRVTLLYGLEEGLELSERQVAGLEGVAQPTVQESRDAALDKLDGDWRLWLLSILVEEQYVRWFDCDHCKNACGYPESTDRVFIAETQAA